jgi:hypothetical protein
MAPANDSESEKEPEQELSPEDELGMYTCLAADDAAANQFTLDNLEKTWRSPIYTFFKPEVTLQYHDGRPCHFFACATKKCKLCAGGMQHFQDSKDKSSTANLKHHVVQCFGEDTVNAAVAGKKTDNCGRLIFSLFACKGKQPVKHSHRVHTNPKVRYVNLEFFSANYYLL